MKGDKISKLDLESASRQLRLVEFVSEAKKIQPLIFHLDYPDICLTEASGWQAPFDKDLTGRQAF